VRLRAHRHAGQGQAEQGALEDTVVHGILS
jgi:hypothetical protein